MAFSHNAKLSRVSCGGRLHDKMGGTSIHANGHRVKRRSATYCYVCSLRIQFEFPDGPKTLDAIRVNRLEYTGIFTLFSVFIQFQKETGVTKGRHAKGRNSHPMPMPNNIARGGTNITNISFDPI